MNDRAFKFCCLLVVALMGMVLLDKVVEIQKKKALDAKADRVIAIVEEAFR